jgi:hypothetical protein
VTSALGEVFLRDVIVTWQEQGKGRSRKKKEKYAVHFHLSIVSKDDLSGQRSG